MKRRMLALAVLNFGIAGGICLMLLCPRLPARAVESPRRSHHRRFAPAADPVAAPVLVTTSLSPGPSSTARSRSCASSLVTIEVYTPGESRPVCTRCAGVLVTRHGHVFAPAPALRGSSCLIACFSDGERSPARVLATDDTSGLAVLKVRQAPSGLSCSGVISSTDFPADGKLLLVSGGQTRSLRTLSAPLMPASVRDSGLIEMKLPGAVCSEGGALFDRRGELAGLVLSPDLTQERQGEAAERGEFVLPAWQMTAALERIVEGKPGTQGVPDASLAGA